MRKIDRPSGRVPIGGEVDGRTTPMTPMLAKKGARIGGIASGLVEGVAKARRAIGVGYQRGSAEHPAYGPSIQISAIIG